MKETALNLTAITIFTLTLAALLGPSLGISPLVTAGVVFAILGVATVDNFSLQGRGSTLFLDWATRQFGGVEYQERILHHEAGHFLVAHLLEIPVTSYSLNAWEALQQGQPGQGGVAFDVALLDQELQDLKSVRDPATARTKRQWATSLLERYAAVWMAGCAAERLVYGQSEGGADDLLKLRILCRELKDSEAEAQQRERWATLKAKTLLEENRAAYDALVEAMRERSTVSDCYRIIHENREAITRNASTSAGS